MEININHHKCYDNIFPKMSKKFTLTNACGIVLKLKQTISLCKK